jgi:hypothetical protein
MTFLVIALIRRCKMYALKRVARHAAAAVAKML